MDKQTENALTRARADGAGPRQKTEKVDGVDYVLQHPGSRWVLKLMDRCKNEHGVLQQEPYAAELLENVVISPKVTLDDFEYKLNSLQKLISKIETFLNSQA